MVAPEATARHFTREEANRTLPLVRLIVRDIVELFGDVQSRRERCEDLRRRRGKSPRQDDLYAEEFRQMEHELEIDEQRLRGLVAELSQIGVEVEDAASGTVAFPGSADDEPLRYFWKLGENEVQLQTPVTTMSLFHLPPPATGNAPEIPRNIR